MTFPGSKKRKREKLNSPLDLYLNLLRTGPSHLKRGCYFNKNNLIKPHYGLYTWKKENAMLKLTV